MFKYDNQNALIYVSEKTNRKYYLLKGYTNNMLSSDIIFIIYYDLDNSGIELVDYLWGDFEEIQKDDYIQNVINDYEKKEMEK